MPDLNTQAINIKLTQNHAQLYDLFGLKPNTVHKIYYDGKDWGALTRQIGKDFGAELRTDGNGTIRIAILTETVFDRYADFELSDRQSIAYQSSRVNQQEVRERTNIDNSVKIIEFKSADSSSYVQIFFETNLLLVGGTVDHIYPLD
jgi:hypothetical protein